MSDTLQNELRRLFAKAKMPTNPALAVRILELAEDPDSTVDQFSQVIQADAALATRLLRMANSVAYGQRQQVTTIQRAVSFLGVHRVRTVSLGFQLIAHLDRLCGCPFDMQRFWQHSILRGCLAREFAKAVIPTCADEAFLIGLLQNCGVLLLVQLLGQPYARLCQTEQLSPTSFFAAEQRDHRYSHPQVTAALAREWRLPEIIVTPMERHHVEPPLMPSPSQTHHLWSVAYIAGAVWLTAPSGVGDNEPALSGFAQRYLNMDVEAVKSCLARAGDAYAEVACLLQDSVPDDLDVTDLLSQANGHLTMSLELEQQRSAAEYAHLTTALGEYRERAARDPLTGVLNRGALNNAIHDSIGQVKGSSDSVMLLFFDLDDFKLLNDVYGHRVGDEVLKAVTQTLQQCIPPDGIVGRYGGEEFVILVRGLAEADAKVLAESVLVSVRGTRLAGLSLPGPITGSLGAVWGTLDPDTTPEDLVRAADELMYQAKSAGKDRCCFRSLDDAYNVDLLESDSVAVHACADAIRAKGTEGKDSTPVPTALRRIAHRLNGRMTQQLSDVRKHQRKCMITPCRLTVLTAVTLQSRTEEAYVRNISTGGIGILATMPMVRGQPAEIAILIGNESRLFVAGVVAFCRHIEGVVHDVGLQLFMHSKQPILSNNPEEAIRNLDWVAHALRRTRNVAAATA